MLKIKKITLLIVIFLHLVFPSQNKAYAETVSSLSQCFKDKCLTKPADVAISSDGAFFLVVDSQVNNYVRKVAFTSGQIADIAIIPLNLKNNNGASLKIDISQDDKKAFVFRRSTDTEDAAIEIIDIKNNTSKVLDLNKLKIKKISAIDFLDNEGKEIIISTTTTDNKDNLIVIDTESNKIEKTIDLDEAASSITVSPSFEKALITYGNVLFQSISSYDLKKDTIETLTIPQSLFFETEGFVNEGKFDLSGNKIVLSSEGGIHVLYFLDLRNDDIFSSTDEKLTIRILNKNLEGQSKAAITSDGKIAIVASNISEGFTDFTIYKILLSDKFPILKSSTINGSGVILNINLSPDQTKVYVLTLKEGKKTLKIFNTEDLSLIKELVIASGNAKDKFVLDPNGKFAISINTQDQNQVSVISNFTGQTLFITLSKETDTNQAIINEFKKLSNNTHVKISQTNSIEISNPPFVVSGSLGSIISFPEITGSSIDSSNAIPSIPQDCSFATIIETTKESLNINEIDTNKVFSTILTDNSGRIFLIGFAFLKNNKQLITTLTIPKDASDGEAKIEILNNSDSIVRVPITIKKLIESKSNKEAIFKPQLKEIVSAIIRKQNNLNAEINLVIKGSNLLKKKDNSKRLTNINFVPDDIQIKNIKFINKSNEKIRALGKLKTDIEPGIKLFNVTTPRCSDIGGVVIPESLTNGKLEATIFPEELILGDINSTDLLRTKP